jgi:hypothetical protein
VLLDHSMSDPFPEFFDQIRRRPNFVKAAAADPAWRDELGNLERRLENLASSAQQARSVIRAASEGCIDG